MGMGLVAGSMSLLRVGCCCSFTSTGISTSDYGYRRRCGPALVLALLPSAIASAAATSTLQPPLLLPVPLHLRRKPAATSPPSSSISPSYPNYYASSCPHNHHRIIPTPKTLTPPFLPTPALPLLTTSNLLAGCKSCFCTAPSSSSSCCSSSDDDNDDEMTKIKEAANTLDIRVGKILKAWRHPEADSLYVEQVDVGEPEPRIICSGLVKYVPLHNLQGINVVVLANLKPRNMRGVRSSGMLMAASNASHENVELLVPPEGSLPGQRIWFGSVDEKESLRDAASPNQIQKKKIWELVQPHLGTDDSCIAALGVHTMRTTDGVVVCKSLKNARIS